MKAKMSESSENTETASCHSETPNELLNNGKEKSSCENQLDLKLHTNINLSSETQQVQNSETSRLCNKSRKCGKVIKHPGRCNKNRSEVLNNRYWITSSVQLRWENSRLNETTATTAKECNQILQKKEELTAQLKTIKTSKEDVESQKNELEDELKKLQAQYDKVKFLVEQKGYAQKRREKNATTSDMIQYSSSSTRYRRLNETRSLLDFLHGGRQGAIWGAWDFICTEVHAKKLEELVLMFKRDKFMENLYGKFNNQVAKTPAAIQKALATKYLTHLSRRKYEFSCKIQKAAFSGENQDCGSTVTYGDYTLNMKTAVVSHSAVLKLANSLDIGEIHSTPGYSGASRTVTAIVTMIVDLHMRVPTLKKQLIWFNDIENHFIFEFSDDGAPESREATMSIGFLTLWNLGNRVRSREYHYLLHMITASEKELVCENLWKQHSEKMLLLEGNILNINREKVTLELQPSTDQAWQIWSNNVLPCSATYPSPFANVHKSELKNMNCTIGHSSSDTWNPPTENSRKKILEKLNTFRKTLKPGITEKLKHDKEMEYMAANGVRQIGEPRIGIFANRQRPEPMHLEINCCNTF